MVDTFQEQLCTMVVGQSCEGTPARSFASAVALSITASLALLVVIVAAGAVINSGINALSRGCENLLDEIIKLRADTRREKTLYYSAPGGAKLHSDIGCRPIARGLTTHFVDNDLAEFLRKAGGLCSECCRE